MLYGNLFKTNYTCAELYTRQTLVSIAACFGTPWVPSPVSPLINQRNTLKMVLCTVKWVKATDINLAHGLKLHLKHYNANSTNIKAPKETFLRAPCSLWVGGLQSPVDTADHLTTDSTPKCGLSPNNIVCVLGRRFHTYRCVALSLDEHLTAFRKNRVRLHREDPESDKFLKTE